MLHESSSYPIDHLRRNGHPVDDHDIERLSPLARDHINFRGRYTINPSSQPQRLRPLRSP
ncbi:MAG: transposase [Actinomycetia bacterium]|nr:transposase [Actinomycetes bacterium]MCP5024766.1 transposase [Actinomycetes bacterium]